MTVELLRSVLGWSALINMAFLTWWFMFFILARDWVYELHTKWFQLSDECFDAIHYAGLAFYKILIFVFNLIPYVVLRFIA